MKRKTANKIRRFLVVSFFVLAVFGILYSIFATNFIRIHNFVFVGTDERHTNTLTSKLNESLNKKIFYFIPSNNLLTYRSSVYKKDVSEVLTNVKEISIHPINLHTIKISTTNFIPAFRQEDGMVISNQGIVYSELNDVSNLPILYSSTTPSVTILDSVSAFIPKLETVLFKIDKIVIDNYGDVYLINAEKGSEVILKSKEDFNKSWSTLISAVGTAPLKNNLELKGSHLKYIDLRFGNKVFYKFTNTKEKDIIAVSTSTYEQATSTGVLAEPNR